MPGAGLILEEAYRVMPRRNDLGTTAEIARAAAPDGGFRWGFSLAEVTASGPFPDFAGCDRVIAVASGAGMRLAVAEREPVVLTRVSAPYSFPDEAATHCTLLAGPIRDLNLMTRRGAARSSLEVLRFAGSL